MDRPAGSADILSADFSFGRKAALKLIRWARIVG